MVTKAPAHQIADELIEAQAVLSHKRRRAQLEKRFTRVFGRGFASRCAERPEISERAMEKAQVQWQVVLFAFLWLGSVLTLAFLGQDMATVLVALLGGVAFRSILAHYARRHFSALSA